MKKSTLALATLLTALSVASITPVAYADDSMNQGANATTGCAGCAGCNAAAAPCTGCKPADASTGTGSDS